MDIVFYVLYSRWASAQVVETSVTNKSPSQDSNHPDDLFQSRNTVFHCQICKFVRFLLPSSSRLLKLPNDCSNAKLHFQMTFSLSSTSCLLKLMSVWDGNVSTDPGTKQIARFAESHFRERAEKK